MNVGERIKKLRTEKGMTVNKLANISGVSQSYLRDIELGNKQPTVEYLSYICEGLGVSLAFFFEDSNERNELDTLISALSTNQKKALAQLLRTLISD